MTQGELRRLERRAAGGDPQAKKRLDDYRRAIDDARRQREREAFEADNEALFTLVDDFVAAEHELPDGTVLYLLARGGPDIAVEADRHAVVKRLLDMEALAEDELCAECEDEECTGCYTDEEVREAWLNAADFTSDGPQWEGGPNQRLYGRYSLPAKWVDACEDEESLDALAKFLGRRSTSSRGSLRFSLRGELDVTRHGGVVLVDDGQSTYAVDEEEWDDAIEAIILERQRLEVALPPEDPDDDGARQETIDEHWGDSYDRLCQAITILGGWTSISALVIHVRAEVTSITDEQREALKVLLADEIAEAEAAERCESDCTTCGGSGKPCDECGWCSWDCDPDCPSREGHEDYESGEDDEDESVEDDESV